MTINKCRLQAPKIDAIAGKWTFEDLIPDMSDFDSRFICADGMTADDWCRMSAAVGKVHLELCKSHPQWARILEHLPGINLTWDELTDKAGYYPEYRQWSFYHCSRPELLEQAKEKLAQRRWDAKDEYFHLKRFLYYYEPYNRSIDPAVNLGPYENKYSLHSRLMHYFTPPLQSAMCILKRQPVAGKMQTLRMACEMFPETKLFDEVIEVVQRHYEVPELYREPALSELETRLFDGLKLIASQLARVITILPNTQNTTPQQWKASFQEVPVAPSLLIFDNAKFSRLMKGRLYFYAYAPSHFDSTWLLRNELKRIGNNFFTVPFRVFWKMVYGENVKQPAEIVPKLSPKILNEEEVRCTLEFDQITRSDFQGREIEAAHKTVDIFDGFFHALYKIGRER